MEARVGAQGPKTSQQEPVQAVTCRSTVAVTGITDKLKKTALWFPLRVH